MLRRVISGFGDFFHSDNEPISLRALFLRLGPGSTGRHWKLIVEHLNWPRDYKPSRTKVGLSTNHPLRPVQTGSCGFID